VLKLVTILGVSLLIVLHELGHFLLARAFGMRVHKFSVGFGPSLLSRRFGETVWQLAAVPLGGYVQIQGMGGDETDPGDGRGFKDKPRWQRALVLLGGPVANWIVAAVCLTLLASTVGLRDLTTPSTELDTVEEGSAAAKAGLLQGDRIVAADEVPIADWDTLVSQIRSHPDTPLRLTVERAGARVEVTATPARSGDHGVLGVQPAARLVRYGAAAGLVAGVRQTVALTVEQTRLLWGVVTGQREGKLSGLPGIVKTLSAQAKKSFGRFFDTLATLSIVLFILNLAPIPALDGGRLAFLSVEAIRRRPLSETVEAWVHGVGLVLLLGLILFVSVRDLL
jgi:regulator of sigma E protease